MKIKEFIKKHKEYFITGAIVIALVFTLYAIFGVFPFGNKTIAHFDMMAQTTPQSELVYDWFSGKSPLFYSTSTGLGANTFGYLIYFILSPFNILALFGGAGNVMYSVNIVFVLKLATIACVACWFLKKYFDQLDGRLVISLSLLYTFCGYMLFNYTFMSFMDYLIYTPLFVHCFNLLKNKGKIIPLAGIVFLMILTCFALGCFTLLYLFVIFGAYVTFCVDKDKRKELIVKTGCAVVMGLGLAMWILVPSLKQYMGSSRKIGFTLFGNDMASGGPTKWAVAINEIISVFFALIYLIKCDKKQGFNKFLFCVCGLTLLTIFSDECMMMLNGGSVFGYFARFGFVGAFTTMCLAGKYFVEIHAFQESKKSVIIVQYVVTVLSIVFFIVVSILMRGDLAKGVSGQNLEIKGTIVYTIFLLFGFIGICVVFGYRKNLGKHFFTIVLLCSIALSGMTTMMHTSGELTNTNHFEQVESLLLNVEGEQRVKFLTNDNIRHHAPTYRVNAIDSFSSLIDSGVVHSLAPLGYFHSANSVYSFGGTILSDIMVGNKYVLSEMPLDRSYLNLIDSNKFYLYENQLVRGMGMSISNVEFTDDYIENQNRLYRALGGVGELLIETDIQYALKNCAYDETTNTIYQTDGKYGELNIEKSLSDNQLLYAYLHGENNGIFINNIQLPKYGIIEVLENTNNPDMKIYKSLSMDIIDFYILDLNKLQALNFNMFEVSKDYNTLKCSVDVEEKQSIVLPYIALDEGYTIKVNGKEVEFTNECLDFMTLEVESGQNNIVIEYRNPLLKFFLLGLAIGIAMIGLSVLVHKLRDKINSKFINIAFFVIVCAVVLTCVAFPSVITILKIFGVGK